MKPTLRTPIVALCFFSFFSQIVAIGRPVTSQDADSQTAAFILSIRQRYANINKRVSRYKKIKKELSGFSLEGGEMIAYFDGPAIVKVVANHSGESGRAVEEYYYSNAKLIFVLRKDLTYNRPLSGKVVKTTVNRFYFQADRLIRWVNESGKQVDSSGAEYQENQNEYLEASRKFVDGARSKNATIEA